MKNIVRDILEIEGVQGVILLSLEGEPLFQRYLDDFPINPALNNQNTWRALLTDDFKTIREIEAVFENRRFYIRKTETGYLTVVMKKNTPVAMVRLNCDLILPLLKKKKETRGFMKIFKRA